MSTLPPKLEAIKAALLNRPQPPKVAAVRAKIKTYADYRSRYL